MTMDLSTSSLWCRRLLQRETHRRSTTAPASSGKAKAEPTACWKAGCASKQCGTCLDGLKSFSTRRTTTSRARIVGRRFAGESILLLEDERATSGNPRLVERDGRPAGGGAERRRLARLPVVPGRRAR